MPHLPGEQKFRVRAGGNVFSRGGGEKGGPSGQTCSGGRCAPFSPQDLQQSRGAEGQLPKTPLAGGCPPSKKIPPFTYSKKKFGLDIVLFREVGRRVARTAAASSAERCAKDRPSHPRLRFCRGAVPGPADPAGPGGPETICPRTNPPPCPVGPQRLT